MKLRNRLSLYSSAIFSVIILVISAIIYFSFYESMERKEMQALHSKSLLAGVFYLDQDELSAIEHNQVKNQLLKTISRKNIAIYNDANQHILGNMVQDSSISVSFLKNSRTQQSASFTTKDYFYNGIFYKDNQGDFVVVTRESKRDFNDQMNSLLTILILASLGGLVVIYLFSQYLGFIAYKPIMQMNEQIKKRNLENFSTPLEVKNSYSEIEDLLKTYNHFIEQISRTFGVQKNFIDYVSHELRTPITALLGTLEVTDHKKRSLEEYEGVIQNLKQYTNDLQETLDQMMLLSGVKTNFDLKPIRIDEVVWQVIENSVLYHHAQIEVDLQVEDDRLLTIQGNDKLLEVAIGNIIGNAIKYSNNQKIRVVFLQVKDKLQIQIIDQGIGILQDDLDRIKQSFVRGNNTQNYQGKGIGLSIANIIFKLHHIEMALKPNQPKGTVVLLDVSSAF